MKNSFGIDAVIEKAKDKLKTAHIDFNSGQYDDAVSRAYYAVYHAITAAHLNKGKAYSSHAQTMGAFNRDFIKSGLFPKVFSRMIQELFEDRQTGDYDVASWIEKETAEKDISNAELILEAINAYLKPKDE